MGGLDVEVSMMNDQFGGLVSFVPTRTWTNQQPLMFAYTFNGLAVLIVSLQVDLWANKQAHIPTDRQTNMCPNNQDAHLSKW